MGIALNNICLDKKIDITKISKVLISSVVPEINKILNKASINYFNIQPFFLNVYNASNIDFTKLEKIQEIGADLVASLISSINLFPCKDLIIIDLGTATTIISISKNKKFLGGVIIPGIKTQLNALINDTSKLPFVEIEKTNFVLTNNTISSIKSGLYYSSLGAIKFLIEKITKESNFKDDKIIIGTGGFSNLFKEEKIFDKIIPNLVLEGLIIAYSNYLEKLNAA
jgi:type III pantothenate kinase